MTRRDAAGGAGSSGARRAQPASDTIASAAGTRTDGPPPSAPCDDYQPQRLCLFDLRDLFDLQDFFDLCDRQWNLPIAGMTSWNMIPSLTPRPRGRPGPWCRAAAPGHSRTGPPTPGQP